MSHLYTIGHSNRPLASFIGLLNQARVDILADVRTIPKSRHNPQFNADMLEGALQEAGIGYKRFPGLGGLRSRSKGQGPSPNDFWHNENFRNYADYAATPSFKAALDALRALSQKQTCAIMCAEADWRHCHRQIIADYLLAAGDTVTHIASEDRLETAQITQAAVIGADGAITYPAAQGQLLL